MSSSLSLEEWRDLELPGWPHKSMLSKTCHLLSETLTAYPACPLQHKLQMPTTLTRVGPGLTSISLNPPRLSDNGLAPLQGTAQTFGHAQLFQKVKLSTAWRSGFLQ